ncbi:polysaccharide pyruvyl transferase CsaB [Thermotoga sp.]|uniref:polysaccharide pyruvyl transferase CsaB n=1 Tax=Thermotoga sp. TaxID=28240 RepID=UPI0025FC19FE|nr:polysaccharide pyruvyl transferase CsaB [Thermotoga sp.]MCD6550653.1 polysaccharide pyruvyl transferase CsaB [Thermotoga sp.]
MATAFLWGYYGFGNFGDELMFRACVDLLKEMDFGTIYTPLPKGKKSMGVTSVDRFSPKLFSFLKRSQISMAGGGGLLQDVTSFRSILYYYYLSKASLLMKKPLIFFGNSIGPVRRDVSKRLVHDVVTHRNAIFIAREPVSYRYVKAMGGNAWLGTDPSILYLMNDETEERKEKKAVFFLKKPIDISHVLRSLRDHGIDDFVLSSAFSKDCQHLPPLRAGGDVLEEIKSSSIVITERFHPALVAAYFEIPFVIVDCQKARRFFRRYTKEDFFFSKRNPLEISLKASVALKKKLNLRERLRKDAVEMKEFLKDTLGRW